MLYGKYGRQQLVMCRKCKNLTVGAIQALRIRSPSYFGHISRTDEWRLSFKHHVQGAAGSERQSKRKEAMNRVDNCREKVLNIVEAQKSRRRSAHHVDRTAILNLSERAQCSRIAMTSKEIKEEKGLRSQLTTHAVLCSRVTAWQNWSRNLQIILWSCGC